MLLLMVFLEGGKEGLVEYQKWRRQQAHVTSRLKWRQCDGQSGYQVSALIANVVATMQIRCLGHVANEWYQSVTSLGVSLYVPYTALGLQLSVYKSHLDLQLFI